MNRGEVWWVEHPEAGRRPYLILSRQEAVPVIQRLLAVPASRTIRGSPGELPLDTDDGMPEPCVLNFDDITSIPKCLFVERLTRLGIDKLEHVCRTLRIVTGC